MKKLFFILLIIGVLVMLRPINSIIKDSIGSIIHRGNVVTGEVAKDNGDGSYDVYIAGEAKAYPKVFTLARNPDLAVGDKVRILYKNGCKELPIILPPVKPTAPISNCIYVSLKSGSTGYIYQYGLNGNLIDTWNIGSEIVNDNYNSLAVDINYNVYTVEENKNQIMKRNSNGILLLTKNETNTIYSIAVGPDGYIYTLDYNSGVDVHISKRNLSDLVVVDSMIIDADGHDVFHGLAIDSSGYIYFVRDDTDTYDEWYERWEWGGGTYLRRLKTEKYVYAKLAVIGIKRMVNCQGLGYDRGVYYVYNVISEDFIELEDLYKPINVGNDVSHFYIMGYKEDDSIVIGKYDSYLNKVWTVSIPNSSNYKCIAINTYPF